MGTNSIGIPGDENKDSKQGFPVPPEHAAMPQADTTTPLNSASDVSPEQKTAHMPQPSKPIHDIFGPAANKHDKKEGQSHPRIKTFGFGVLGGIVGALLVSALLIMLPLGKSSDTSSPMPTGTITINNNDQATTAEAVAAKALPSTVSITATSNKGGGLGSGVIFDTKGNIITNYHVIAGATKISVMIDGKTYAAKLVGSDSSSDIAVVRAELQGAKVTPITVGNSDKLVVGQWVMTLGSPFGLDQSVSTGIVSALYRSTLLPSTSGTTVYANLIQIDAAINRGNSGGPLVNAEGQLVGINTLLESSSGDFSGIGFAIPGNYAVSIAEKIIAGQKVTHAYIGLSMLTVNAYNAAANHLPVDQGAYVADVIDGGPAAKAGLKHGDIITKINGKTITSADGVIIAIREHSEGDVIKVTFIRDNRSHTVEVTLGNDEKLQEEQRMQEENSAMENGMGDNSGNRSDSNSNSNSRNNQGDDFDGNDPSDFFEYFFGR